MFIYLTDHTQ